MRCADGLWRNRTTNGKEVAMDVWPDAKTFQYAVIFVGTGLVAVVIKALGDLGEGRLAGIVAMLPVKILAAWVILGVGLGSAAIRDSVVGMFVGLIAIAGMLAAGWLAAGRLGPLPSIIIGVAVWLVLILAFVTPWWNVVESGP